MASTEGLALIVKVTVPLVRVNRPARCRNSRRIVSSPSKIQSGEDGFEGDEDFARIGLASLEEAAFDEAGDALKVDVEELGGLGDGDLGFNDRFFRDKKPAAGEEEDRWGSKEGSGDGGWSCGMNSALLNQTT